mgnify:CR=1 FL=1
MPWIAGSDPYAATPRVRPPEPDVPWPGAIAVEDGFAEVVDVAVPATTIELLDCHELALRRCALSGVTLALDPSPVVDAYGCTFENCDLSRVRFGSSRETTFVNCKLVGADLAGARLDDVVFEGCIVRYANMRQIEAERVRFADCTFDDVDFYEARLVDVAWPGSELRTVNIDRVRAERVDAREATVLGFEAVGRMDGWLVTELQLHELLYPLAFASGLGVEQPDDHG